MLLVVEKRMRYEMFIKKYFYAINKNINVFYNYTLSILLSLTRFKFFFFNDFLFFFISYDRLMPCIINYFALIKMTISYTGIKGSLFRVASLILQIYRIQGYFMSTFIINDE